VVTGADPYRRLGVAVRDHLCHLGQFHDFSHQRARVAGRRENVDVADRFRKAPQRAGVLASLAARHRADHGDDPLGDVGRDVQRHPLSEAAGQLDAAPQLVLAPGPEPAQVPQPSLVDRGRQLGNGADPELPVELERALRPERGDLRHLPDPVGHRGAELLQRLDRAGLLELGDLRRDRPGTAPGICRMLVESSRLTSPLKPATDLAAFS